MKKTAFKEHKVTHIDAREIGITARSRQTNKNFRSGHGRQIKAARSHQVEKNPKEGIDHHKKKKTDNFQEDLTHRY